MNRPGFGCAWPQPRALESTSDEKGEVTICGVPIRQELRVTVAQRGRLTRSNLLTLGPERVLQVVVRITVRP